jgi:hypothetical protein
MFREGNGPGNTSFADQAPIESTERGRSPEEKGDALKAEIKTGIADLIIKAETLIKLKSLSGDAFNEQRVLRDLQETLKTLEGRVN